MYISDQDGESANANENDFETALEVVNQFIFSQGFKPIAKLNLVEIERYFANDWDSSLFRSFH